MIVTLRLDYGYVTDYALRILPRFGLIVTCHTHVLRTVYTVTVVGCWLLRCALFGAFTVAFVTDLVYVATFTLRLHARYS